MKLSWLPGSYMAAVSITDDPDDSSFPKLKAVYDFLMETDFPVTRAMWVYPKTEYSGTPPIKNDPTAPLLNDPECLQYCKKLHSKGFEICLHGASSGNNDRKRTLDALNFLEEHFEPSPIFICHSKNAENLYWDANTANSPVEKMLLQLYTKNRCFGEIPDSRYFWGDICREKINYIRLYRTRSLNTLAFNPSMPYHDFSKPFVNYWFSATKGYIPKLLSEKNLDELCSENGAGILYQYMHKYVNDDLAIPKQLREAMERVAADGRILKKPASFILNRLKAFQNVLTVKHLEHIYLINASEVPVESVKVFLQRTDDFCSDTEFLLDKINKTVIFPRIEPLSFIRFKTPDSVSNNKQMKLQENFGILKFHRATVYVNLSGKEALLNMGSQSPLKVNASGVFVKYSDPEAERLKILKEIPLKELYGLKAGQFLILLREHLFLGRKISTSKYLDNPGKSEDLSNW
ncbi:MAG: hypothetical protein GX267_16540 [Fibrobacter sp.]|nr:hypothetical protein [Fibrobacter sp.]